MAISINAMMPNAIFAFAFGRSADMGGRSGPDKEVRSGPTRLIVRDSHPTDETIERWDSNEDILHGTEIKGENYLNRITSMATPRFVERVPAGSEFSFEMIFSVYDPKDEQRLKLVFEAMSLLEDNYIGGYGSRGSGKITFRDITLKEKSAEDYNIGKEWQAVSRMESIQSPRDILNRL